MSWYYLHATMITSAVELNPLQGNFLNMDTFKIWSLAQNPVVIFVCIS